MDASLRERIVDILLHTRDITIATNRPDGYPQATVVSFVNDGLKLYFGCSESSQKAKNIARDNRISVTATCDYGNWDEIKGVSMAAIATRITEQQEIDRAGQLMFAKFPQIAKYTPPEGLEMALFRIDPIVISLLDYSKEFGHTELVSVA